MADTAVVAATVTKIRSLLFVPGDKPAMIAKLPRFAPDIAVVDLEDAVAAADKIAARPVAVRAIDEMGGALPVLLRVNVMDSPWFADDLAAAAGCAAYGVVVPKLDSVDQVRVLHQALAALSWTSPVIIAGIETALGVADSREVLSAGVSACYFGAEDFVADVGARRTRDSAEVHFARSQVLLSAHLAGIPAVDQAVMCLDDDEHFRADARAGVELGYQGKLCIHPRQVDLSHEVFTPTAGAVAHARLVVAAADDGVSVIDGQMVDDVHVRMARTVLARAGEGPG